MKCKHCGSDKGFYSKLKGVQYYDKNALADGYEVDVQGNSIYCRNCNKRVCSVSHFINREEKRDEL